MARGSCYVDRMMAINPGNVFGSIEGLKTKEPTYGLEAYWIQLNQKEKAQSLGFTVVDPSTVIATHLSHIMQLHSADLLGHDEVQQLLDRLKETSPKLVEELIPDKHPLSIMVRVLQNLLLEEVSIRDIRTIAETLAEGPQNRGILTL